MRIGLGETNHIAVRAIGSEFVFYINDQPVWRLSEDFVPGQIGLGVDVAEKSSDEQVEFSNFEIKTP